jgi:hypothetical protein
MDYTERIKWDKKRAQIDENYRIPIEKCDNQISAVESEIRSFEDDIQYIQHMEPVMECELSRLRAELDSKKQYIEAQKNMAQREYLKMLKRQLANDVGGYLEQTQESMEVNYEEAVKKNRESLEKRILNMYDKAIKEQIRLYKGYLDKGKTDTVSIQSQEFLEQLQQSKRLLEEVIQE